MNEIWFRAKCKNWETLPKENWWVEGFYVMYSTSIAHPYSHTNGEHCIITVPHNIKYEINFDTICQYKNIDDKNGIKMFDEDICVYSNSEGEYGVGIIRGDYVSWIRGNIRHLMTPLFYLKCGEEWEVIGNTFDNPELLDD